MLYSAEIGQKVIITGKYHNGEGFMEIYVITDIIMTFDLYHPIILLLECLDKSVDAPFPSISFDYRNVNHSPFVSTVNNVILCQTAFQYTIPNK